MLDWNGIRDFLTVLEAGSLTAAAAQLNVSQPTLSRRISALEAGLGTKLLIRTPRHLQLTDAGKRIQEQAIQMGMSANALESTALGLDALLEGNVRISTTELVGIHWLTPLLAEFNETHPGIRVELSLDNSLVNLQRREADIAVRLLKPTQQEIVTRHVADIGSCFYASRSYVEKYGRPLNRGMLGQHRGIGLTGNTSTSLWVRELFGDDGVHFQFSTLMGVQSAVESGLGIGPILCYFGDKNPDLVRVLQGEEMMRKEVWLCTLPEYHTNMRIRAVYDFIRTMFIKYRQSFKG